MKRPEINKKPKVGDKVFVVECGDNARFNINQGKPADTHLMEVEKVGRQYFYIKKGWREIKVSIKGWREFSVYSPGYELYENEEIYNQVQRWNYLSSKINKFISDNYGKSKPVTLYQLEQIAKILNISEEDKSN